MFFSRSKPPEAGARDESTSPLDLRRLENRLRVEDGVADPAKAISEYLDWLGDVVAGFKLDPTKFTQALSLDVDKVWQRHQLDTRAYMQDCRALFGDAHLPEREMPHYVHRSVGTRSEPLARSFCSSLARGCLN